VIRVGDQKIGWREGMTVSDLLEALDDAHPYAVVRINDTYVSRPHFDKTVIPDNAQVFLVPMVAGG
jgi:thiamine biosynthesis protein ThiS